MTGQQGTPMGVEPMSVMRVSETAPPSATPVPPAPPRVREQARAALVVMVFSAGLSVATTLIVLLVTGLGH